MKDLKDRAKKLGFRAIVANWEKYIGEKWLEPLIVAEESEKDKRSLERRLKEASIGEFKPMADFDWSWRTKIDREQIEDLLTLDFLKDGSNIVLLSTNGFGQDNDCAKPRKHCTWSRLYNQICQSQSHAQSASRMRWSQC